MQESQAAAKEATQTSRPRRNRRPKRRALFCPRHPEQRIEGNGKKYYLHLLQPEQLQQRGMSAKRAQLVINAYPVLVLSDEWLEELFCPLCGQSRWCRKGSRAALGLAHRRARRRPAEPRRRPNG